MTVVAPATSLEVRERLVEALKLDLVGPWADHPLAEERLPGWIRPSMWYLTGFLILSGTPPEQSADVDEDDDFSDVAESAGLTEESSEEQRAAILAAATTPPGEPGSMRCRPSSVTAIISR